MHLFRLIGRALRAFPGGGALRKQIKKLNVLRQQGLRLADEVEALIDKFPTEISASPGSGLKRVHVSSGSGLTLIQDFRSCLGVRVPLENYGTARNHSENKAIIDLAVKNLTRINATAGLVIDAIKLLSGDVPYINEVRANFDQFIRSIRKLKAELNQFEKKIKQQPQFVGSAR